MIMKGQLRRMSREEVAAYFQVLVQYLPEASCWQYKVWAW